MLSTLYIKNYAIIDEIKIEFNKGFTTITGETGAGKSIILGALSLVLGNRVDSNILKNQDSKCIIEAEFKADSKQLVKIFEENDLDFDNEIILRREISAQGKSRAFVNDSPVNLNILAQIAEYLIDIHSQHQNIYLRDQNFLLSLLDKYSDNEKNVESFQSHLKEYTTISNQLFELRNEENSIKSELDYLSFQLKELNEFKLEELDLKEIENDLNIQENAEEILNNLSEINSLLENDEIGIINQIKAIQNHLKRIQNFHYSSKEYLSRFESILIEIQDLQMEITSDSDNVTIDPEKLVSLQTTFNTINSLFTKHRVDSIQELINIRNTIKNKINTIESFDEQISDLEKNQKTIIRKLSDLGTKISNTRKVKSKIFEDKIKLLLSDLGINKGEFIIQFDSSDKFLSTGTDKVEFLFSSNSGIEPQILSKVASGGEISRLMLSIKTILSEKVQLPTVIFDEIDAGISGEIADKMGDIMHQLSQNMQIISITHLPQIACKGNEQFIVQKRLTNNKTVTTIKKLNQEERINEIARLLSGSSITAASIENAKELLNL